MKRIWPGGVVALLAVICLVLGGGLARKAAQCRQQSSQNDDLRARVAVLDARAHARLQEVDSLRTRLKALASSPIDAIEIGLLRRRGLENPVQDLVADLQRHPEIIPYQGVLGGRMGFYDRDRIRVLNDSWVYALFDDGHIVGHGIFGYHVASGGKISWRVIAARQP
jgi:hypothetical protein